ncbi:Uncharacterised protein [Mycobacteroides abscessus subsp. abscessus]|nr:Uncharacterised protein [Mycobacteroides abscessus subsp. abscessus]
MMARSETASTPRSAKSRSAALSSRWSVESSVSMVVSADVSVISR